MKEQEKNEKSQTEKRIINTDVSALYEKLENKQVSLIDKGNMLTRIARITRGDKTSYNIAIGNKMLLQREEEFETEEIAQGLLEDTNIIERIIVVMLNLLIEKQNQDKNQNKDEQE